MFTRLKPYRVEIFFLLLALIPHLVIAFSNPNTILDWYSSDDGFYYFRVARNLVAGSGFTFDGLNPTNGFHPLWLFLITPVFAFAQIDLILPLRLLIILSTLLSAGTAILLYRILRRYTSEFAAALAGLAWIILPRIHDITLHAGVEAGLNAFCILLFWHQLVTIASVRSTRGNPQEILRGLARLGLLACLALLARLDNVFLVAIGGMWIWWRLWKPLKNKTNPWRWRLATGFAFMTPILIVLMIYVIWNQFAFGTPIPVSGSVKLWWGTLRNTVYGFPVRHMTAFWGQFVTDHPELGPWSLFTAPLYAAAEWLLTALGQGATIAARRIALLSIGGVLAALGAALVWAQRAFLTKATRGLGLLPFFLGCFAHIAYYKFSGSVAQQPWYWVAQMLFLLLCAGLLVEALWRVFEPRLPRAVNRYATAGVILIAVLSLNFLAFIQSAVREPGDGSNHFYIHRARWLEEHTEPGARVAITGAGNLAYFSNGRTIVNMDGLMNSYEYFLALKAGRGAEFLADLGVDYIFGNEYILTETNPYAPMLAGHLQPYEVYVFVDRQLPLWRFIP